jgi:DNA replication protein DnaC
LCRNAGTELSESWFHSSHLRRKRVRQSFRRMNAENLVSARLQLAHLPFIKTFDHFDFSFQPSIDERQIRELRSLRFIHEASDVILLGPPGVGKTHLSVALATAWIDACGSTWRPRFSSSSNVKLPGMWS